MLGLPGDEAAAKPWSRSDVATLIRMRDDGQSWKEITVAFPERTLTAIQARWKKQMVGKYCRSM